MNPKLCTPQRNLPRGSARPGFENVVLRLVTGGPERVAIAAGQIDAIVDSTTGKVILLPEAQRALVERKARLRSLLALCTDWTWEQDEHYCFSMREGAGVGACGFDDSHIIGKTLWELPFNNMSEADWRMHRTQLEWRATYHDLELRHVDRAGEEHWISLNGEPVFDEQDRFKGYRGTTRDITGRKQAEQLLGLDYTVTSEVPGANREPANRVSVANNLLAALPHVEYQRLLTGLEPVTLTCGEVLYAPGAPIRQVYFPIDCVISLLMPVEGHRALEVGLVGHEGMVGVPLALGSNVSPMRALVQSGGTAMRMEAAPFRKELLQNIPLQRVLYRHAHALMAQFAQTAACSHFHGVQARLARWLLMTRDRVRSNEFHLTHEFLAQMLGVRRVGVTNAAGALQKQELISYNRGNIKILDRKGLEAAACKCYRIIKSA